MIFMQIGFKFPSQWQREKTKKDGILHGTNGEVAASKEEMKIRQKYIIFPVQVQNASELYIVIHVSNFDYFKAGLWENVILGDTQKLLKKQFYSIFVDLVVFGSLFIMGLYHLGLYINRKKDVSPLHFG
jgi:hypothetical protein